jgi:hypothetical protein
MRSAEEREAAQKMSMSRTMSRISAIALALMYIETSFRQPDFPAARTFMRNPPIRAAPADSDCSSDP